MSTKYILVRLLTYLVAASTSVAALFELSFVLAPDNLVLDFGATQSVVSSKSGNLSANFNGVSFVPNIYLRSLRFRSNGGDWNVFGTGSPRLGSDHRLFEIEADRIVFGENTLDVRFRSIWGNQRTVTHDFVYDARLPDFPIIHDWKSASAEVQDGFWEVFESPTLGNAFRPVLDTEGYDRLALVAPPFRGGRRTTVDIRFVRATGHPFGFGLLPFWGGHIDDGEHYPRRGWEYGIAWYYSSADGVGVEFSKKIGSNPHQTERMYIQYQLEPGDVFRIIAEANSQLSGKTIRLKIKRLPDGQFSDWITYTDSAGRLTDSQYAVALVAHRAQVEFGPVTVERLAVEDY